MNISDKYGKRFAFDPKNLTQKTISKLPSASGSKRVFVRNHSYENVFRSLVHCHANQTHFHMKGFAGELVLQMGTENSWESFH